MNEWMNEWMDQEQSKAYETSTSSRITKRTTSEIQWSTKTFKLAQSRTRSIKLVDDITNIRWRLWSNKAAFLRPHSDKVWGDSHKITN